MDINALVIFHKVAETNSFSVASRILEIPISTISRKINKLEEELNRKLFIRSTRKINLTIEGQTLYDSSKPLFEDFNALNNLFENDNEITGDIRITSTIESKCYLAPKIVEFRRAYPNINLFINFSNDIEDMIENSYDFAFRAGNLKDSSLYSYKLYDELLSAYVHQSFFSGVDPKGLEEFDYCIMKHTSTLRTLDGQVIKPKNKIMSNSIDFIIEYAKNQPSIIYVPESHIPNEFVKLNVFESHQTSFQIVYLHKKLSRHCSLFLEFFKKFKEPCKL
jgi:DNA-binding transcriptional LysR family regulator